MYEIVAKIFSTQVMILGICSFLSAQTSISADANFLKNQLTNNSTRPEYPIEKTESNEIKIGVQLFFLFYKSFLSSQDNRHCSFSPSCSTYCLHSIKKRGVVVGLMGAFDRLSRCNYLSLENYPIDPVTGQLLDPVEQ